MKSWKPGLDGEEAWQAITPQRCPILSWAVPPLPSGTWLLLEFAPSGRIPTFQRFPDFTSISPFLIGMFGLLHSGLGRSSLFLWLAWCQMSSLQAVPRCTSSAVWNGETEGEIRSAALGDGIVSNKPCMTQSFHFKWGMKLLHPLTACSMKEIYLHLIASDPKRLCTVISRR